MTGLVDESTAEDIVHLDLSKALDTVSLSAGQMEGGVSQKTENRLKGMVSGTKSKWSPILNNILIDDVGDGQSIPTADRTGSGVLGGCGEMGVLGKPGEMGGRNLLVLWKEECKVLGTWVGRGTSICWGLSEWGAAWQERSW